MLKVLRPRDGRHLNCHLPERWPERTPSRSLGLHASIGPADLRRPLEGIPSTVPLHDALFLYGEAVQSNHLFREMTAVASISPACCVQARAWRRRRAVLTPAPVLLDPGPRISTGTIHQSVRPKSQRRLDDPDQGGSSPTRSNDVGRPARTTEDSIGPGRLRQPRSVESRSRSASSDSLKNSRCGKSHRQDVDPGRTVRQTPDFVSRV